MREKATAMSPMATIFHIEGPDSYSTSHGNDSWIIRQQSRSGGHPGTGVTSQEKSNYWRLACLAPSELRAPSGKSANRKLLEPLLGVQPFLSGGNHYCLNCAPWECLPLEIELPEMSSGLNRL
jgi:hypothetical protein